MNTIIVMYVIYLVNTYSLQFVIVKIIIIVVYVD